MHRRADGNSDVRERAAGRTGRADPAAAVGRLLAGRVGPLLGALQDAEGGDELRAFTAAIDEFEAWLGDTLIRQVTGASRRRR